MLTVYTKTHCPYCDQAKALLKQKGVEFTAVNIEENPDMRTWLMEQGHRSVPQIYMDDKIFVEGGFQGLAKLSDVELHQRLGDISVSN